jgi:hypothetical protein
METSKCFSQQVTQLFVDEICATFYFYLVNYEIVWKSQLWHFLFICNLSEANKGIIL